MKRNRFKIIFWSQVVILLGLSLATILPLGFGYTYGGVSPPEMVSWYYYGSFFILCVWQILYLWPLKTFSIDNYPAYISGLAILAVVLSFWVRRGEGRTLDLSEIESGNMIGPVLFSIVLPLIQAFTHVIGTSFRDNRNV